MLKRISKFLLSFILVVSSFFILDVQASEFTTANVGYQIEVLDNWTDYSFGGALSGSEGLDKAQGLSVHLVNAPYESAIEYRVYTQSGWKDWVRDFGIADGNGMDILGVQIKLVNYVNADVHYQVYRKGLGWGTWVKNGSTAGNLNTSNPITGIRVKVFEVGVKYQSSISNNWLFVRHNAEDQGAGVLETVRIDFENPITNARIVYRAYFSNSGWTNWAKNWETLGQSGSNKQLEALEVKLENLPGYSVAVQPYVKGAGWSDWVYDGGTAGNIGLALEAYRIKIVKAKYIAPTLNDEFDGVGTNPGTTTLTYSAGENAYEDYDDERLFMGYSELTVDGVFDDNPAGISVEMGDQFTASKLNFSAGNHISVPNTFDGWGDNTVDDEQFEVYYGTYINGVFTVISTRYELENDNDGYDIDEDFLTTETHTLILYDNDPEFLVNEDEDYTIISKSASEYPVSIVIDGNTYNVSEDWDLYIDGYVIFNDYETGINVITGGQTYLNFDGSNMILDGFVLEGVFYEQGWYVGGEADSRYMYYDLQFAIDEDGRTINFK